MTKPPRSKVIEFVINHWVSWVIEFTVLGIVACFTIAETRKTAEETRNMLRKYDAAISKYASEKTQAVDNAVGKGVESAQEKAKSTTVEDVKGVIKAFREKPEEDETE